MPRQFEDIVPPKRRSIQDIKRAGALGQPLWRSTRERAGNRRNLSEKEPYREEAGRRMVESRRKWLVPFSVFRIKLGVLIVLSIVALFLVFSFVFSDTKVMIEPKQQETFVDAEFEAFRAASSGTLSYEIMTAEKTGSEIVPATMKREVEERASGRIVIFNNHDGLNQRLIKNTRFETPDGLIYRIDQSVVVPGRVKKDDTVTPGSVEVTVYAEDPGPRYNIGLTDFTIPGFSGSPRFEGFFARSKTAMTGGFVGEKLVVNHDTLEETRARIRESLRDALLSEARAQKPDGFLLFEDGIFIEFNALPDVEESDNSGVEIRESGTLRGILFEERAFAEYIAKQTLAGYDDEPVVIHDSGALSLSIREKETVRPWEEDSFVFALSGSARIVWLYNADALRNDLAGRSRGALQTILSGYPGILRAKVVLRPIWRSEFPSDPSDIVIKQTLEK